MRYSQIVKGLQARRRGVPFRTLDGSELLVDVCVIGGEGQARILEYATAFAKKRGGEPKDGAALFEFGKAVMTCALGILVHSPERAGEDPCRTNPSDSSDLFFAGPEEVLEACDRDRAMILASHQTSLQTSTSPMKHGLTDEEFFAKVVDLARKAEGGDSRFFEEWAPGMQESFMRSMAQWLVASLASQTPKSPTTSTSEQKPEPASPSTESENE